MTNLHVRSITLGTGCGDYFQKGRSGGEKLLAVTQGEVMGLSHGDDGGHGENTSIGYFREI